MFERILVAVDGSDNALRAVDAASAIAAKFGAELVLVTVLDSLRHSAGLKKFAEAEELDEPRAELAKRSSPFMVPLGARPVGECHPLEPGNPLRCGRPRQDSVERFVR